MCWRAGNRPFRGGSGARDLGVLRVGGVGAQGAARRPLQDAPRCWPPPTRSGLAWKRLTGWRHFRSNPRIGERKAPALARHHRGVVGGKTAQGAAAGDQAARFAEGIESTSGGSSGCSSCAQAGNPRPEILGILRRRLQNDEATELQEAVEGSARLRTSGWEKWLLR